VRDASYELVKNDLTMGGGGSVLSPSVFKFFLFSKKIITDEKNLIKASDLPNVDGSDDCKSMTQCFC